MSLTVVSVSHHESAYLRFQDHVMRSLAADADFDRLVANVAPTPEEESALSKLPRTRVIRVDPGNRVGSETHGFALGRVLPLVQTEHTLIIDPDCVPLLPRWDSVCAAELVGSCAAMGAAYAPGSPRYVGFPVVVFLFAKTAALPRGARDWEPEASWIRRQKSWLRARLGIPFKDRDTGWRVARAFRRGRLEAACFDFLKCHQPRSVVLAPDCRGDEHHWKGRPIACHQGRSFHQPFGGGPWSWKWVRHIGLYLGADDASIKNILAGADPRTVQWTPLPKTP